MAAVHAAGPLPMMQTGVDKFAVPTEWVSEADACAEGWADAPASRDSASEARPALSRSSFEDTGEDEKYRGFGLPRLNLAVRVLTMSCGVIHFRIMPRGILVLANLTSCCVHHLEPTKDEIRKKNGLVCFSATRSNAGQRQVASKRGVCWLCAGSRSRGWRVPLRL